MYKKIMTTIALCFLLSAIFLPVTTVSAEETGWISGTVSEGYITPLQGVTVSVVGKTTTATTGADGKYNISLAVGSYDLKFTKANYKDYTRTSVSVQANKTVTVSVNMEKAKGGIKGKVTDKSTNKPIKNAWVELGVDWLLPPSDFTDANGNYELSGIPVGSYQVNCTVLGEYKAASKPVTVTANANATVDFSMEPIPVYLLVKVSDGGVLGFPDPTKPISGATVTLDDKTLTTGTDGFANFTNLQKRKYNITITAKNFKKYSAKTTDIGAPDMASGSQSYSVGLISNKATNSLFGAALLCLLIPIIVVVIIVVVIIVVILMLRKKKAKAQPMPPPGQPAQQPYAAPPPTAPQQPQTYEQMYGTPPPQQPGYSQPPAQQGQQYQGYSQPPAPPGQQGQYQQPPPPY